MSYIGNTQQNQSYFPAVDFFSGNGSTTAFTLTRPVTSTAAIQVHIANVAQNPSDAYTVSGSTITFTSAPPSGTNNIYVYYTSPNNTVITPSDGTVQTSSIANNAVTAAKLATSGLNASALTTGTLPKAQLPSGSVVQVVNVVMSTVFTTTGNGVAITGASLSITPTSASNKILVIATGSVNKGGGGDALIYLARNGTPIGNGTGGTQLNGFVDTSQSYGYLISSGATTVFDNPATTSAVTYALYVANNNSNTVYVNGRGNPTDFGMPCTITAMEIAA